MSQPQKPEKEKPKAAETKPADKPKDTPKQTAEPQKAAEVKPTEKDKDKPKTNAESSKPADQAPVEKKPTVETPRPSDVKPTDKPATKPAEKASEKTAEKPVDNPITKPSDKPVEKPADKPVEKAKEDSKDLKTGDKDKKPVPELNKSLDSKKGHNDSMRDSSHHSIFPDGNQSNLVLQVMNKSGLAPLQGGKKTLTEELNLRLKDTYSSPVIGLKYSHERLVEKYSKDILGARQERYREILEKIKDKVKPMDHEQLHKREMEYISNRMKEKELRLAEMEKQLFDFNHPEFRPHKSNAYKRVANEEVANPRLEKLEKAKKALETRKQYSEIVKDIFFKDALLAGRTSQSQHNLKYTQLPELTSSRDPKEEADRKRKEEFDNLKLRHDLGNQYLEHVRQVNERIPMEKRKEMDMKRFQQRKEAPRKMKSRKYLDEIARKFDEPKEIIFQKDLIRKLKPNGTDSKNALIANIKNYDTNMKLKEVRMRFDADSKHQGNSLGDLYINSIENKLKILDTEIKKSTVINNQEPADGASQPNHINKQAVTPALTATQPLPASTKPTINTSTVNPTHAPANTSTIKPTINTTTVNPTPATGSTSNTKPTINTTPQPPISATTKSVINPVPVNQNPAPTPTISNKTVPIPSTVLIKDPFKPVTTVQATPKPLA